MNTLIELIDKCFPLIIITIIIMLGIYITITTDRQKEVAYSIVQHEYGQQFDTIEDYKLYRIERGI